VLKNYTNTIIYLYLQYVKYMVYYKYTREIKREETLSTESAGVCVRCSY